MNVDDIATQALSMDTPATREAFLDQACGQDAKLREKVEGLIAALESADEDSFLSSGLFASPKSETASSDTTDADSVQNQVGIDEQRFEIRTKHAVGGLGEVWIAWDRQLGREVALKQMRPEWANNLDAAARFRREAEITGYLEHPGVVPIYALGDQGDGCPFYAMQFIRGRTLQQVVEDEIRPTASKDSVFKWYDQASLRKMLDHFVDVCQTIDYAHSKQVVHRDLKPANIMLGAYGQTLVVDWGLAKRLDQVSRDSESSAVAAEIDHALDAALSLTTQSDSSVDETRQGTTLGTPRFMSPEQAAGKIDEIGPAADIYCLGSTLYYILSGQAPHVGESDLKSTFEKIVSGQFEQPIKIRSEIPKALQAIVLKAMATTIQERYQTAGQLAEDVQRYLADQPVAVFSDPPIERVLRWTRNHRALTAAMAVGLLLTFVGTVTGLLVRQEMDRREMESARQEAEDKREIQFQARTRLAEATAAYDAAMERSEDAIEESRFADAAALVGVAIDSMKNQGGFDSKRQILLAKQARLDRLGKFDAMHQIGEDLDNLARDTEAAILLQESLGQLGVWDSQTWWNDLPDDDLSAVQRDRLRWQVYRILTALNSIYVTKMVGIMGGESGGTPNPLKLLRSYLSSNVGKREARATVELTRRIQTFRTSESARWLGSIASFRLHGGKRVEARELGAPNNPPDGQSLGIFNLIATVDPGYRMWFSGYGDTFMPKTQPDPSQRALSVALESLRRVSDEAPHDFWIRLLVGQTYYLFAQKAEDAGDYAEAIEHYELARSEYGRCISIRDHVAFGYADRSTVALGQAVLMRDHDGASEDDRQRSLELLEASFRDASHARRLRPAAHWVYWHVGATAVELGQIDTAIEAFFKAVDLGFDVQNTLDVPIIRLDDLRGRTRAVEFANRDAGKIMRTLGNDPSASRRAALIASLDYSRGNFKDAAKWSEKAVELDSTNHRAHQIAGWCAFRDRDLALAERHFVSAIESSPTDTVSLIGAALVAEQKQNPDLVSSDKFYRQAIRHAVSQRHRSTAWFGIAKHSLRRGELDEAESAIDTARQLDPACDVSQFIDLARDEAKRLLVLSKRADSEDQRLEARATITRLKSFLDYVSALPTASVNQIVKSASELPPSELPILGSRFELPLETYWRLKSGSEEDVSSDSTRGGSPPFQINSGVAGGEGPYLMIRRAEPDRATMHWRLHQTVPATSGHVYRLSVRYKTPSIEPDKVVVTVQHSSDQLVRLPLSNNASEWTTDEQTFVIEADSYDSDAQTITPIVVAIEVADPEQGSVLLDEVRIDLSKD